MGTTLPARDESAHGGVDTVDDDTGWLCEESNLESLVWTKTREKGLCGSFELVAQPGGGVRPRPDHV